MRAFVKAFLDRIGTLEARVEELERQMKGKTPQRSWLTIDSKLPTRVSIVFGLKPLYR
jgi:hypothetical protein